MLLGKRGKHSNTRNSSIHLLTVFRSERVGYIGPFANGMSFPAHTPFQNWVGLVRAR